VAAFLLMSSPCVAGAFQEPAPKAAAAQDASSLKDDQEKSSYAVGMNLGAALRRQSPDLDVNLIVQGFRDALAGGKTLLSPAEVRTILARLQAEQKAKQGGTAAKAKAEGEAFLAENKAKDGVVTLASGLQYKVLKAGEGKKPTIEDTVICNYRGTLIDGTEFDSSFKRNKPATLALNRVIKGWAEALQLMPAGSKWQLFIPSSLAYGERGSGKSIGPNAALIFEVELVSIQEASSVAGSKTRSDSTAGPLDETPAAKASALAGINVSVKLDPRITKGLYLGDRWLALPYTQIGESKQVSVEAKAEGVDGHGRPVSITPEWIPADPEMVTVAPGQGSGVVKITARRPGESRLRVTSQEVSRELTVKAAHQGNALQVEIAQHE